MFKRGSCNYYKRKGFYIKNTLALFTSQISFPNPYSAFRLKAFSNSPNSLAGKTTSPFETRRISPENEAMKPMGRAININASAKKINVDNRISLHFYYRIANNLLKQVFSSDLVAFLRRF